MTPGGEGEGSADQSAALTPPLPLQTCTFVNDSSYNHFLPSFHVLLPPGLSQLELRLCSRNTSLPLIGWLLRDTEIWHRLVPLEGQCPHLPQHRANRPKHHQLIFIFSSSALQVLTAAWKLKVAKALKRLTDWFTD